MRSRATNADHEQTGSIGGSDDLLAIEYDGHLSLDRDAQQPGLRGELDGAEPDRRLIGTAFLIRLLDLDEHPAKPFAPQGGAPLQKCVGALDRLDTEHESLLNDHGLPDVESAQGLRDPQAVLDIGLRLLVRPDGTERALARDLGCGQKAWPRAGPDGARGVKGVESPQPARVRSRCFRAAKRDRWRQRQGDTRHAARRVRSLVRPLPRGRAQRHLVRLHDNFQSDAAAGPHCQPRCRAYSPFASLGWQIARLESARMNSRISSTGAMPPKRSAVSLTRSLSVPSEKNKNW